MTSGKILIDDQPINEVTQSSLHRAIGMIPQDPTLFHRSLKENIGYGLQGATEEMILEAAKKAHVDEFISNLPQGYDSLVGERGVKLSGGQRQRIAIARAILKNAPILIISTRRPAPSTRSRRARFKTVYGKLTEGKTTIAIAHRLSTLLHMDRILVFEKGRIVEDGTHQELLAKKGKYKTFWDAQVLETA